MIPGTDRPCAREPPRINSWTMQYRGPEIVARPPSSLVQKCGCKSMDESLTIYVAKRTCIPGEDQAPMPHQPPADRSVLDSALDPPLAMDDETIRALETDVRLATHLRALS